MLDTAADTTPDRRPAIVICTWNDDPVQWNALRDASGQVWQPQGARTVAVGAGDPEALAETLGRHLIDMDTRGLLLFGRTRRDSGYRVQLRAENRALGSSRRLTDTGPGVARSTAPVAEIVRALGEAGMAAEATSEAEDDVGSYLLYRVLTGLRDGTDTPSIGLLRAPETADEEALRSAVMTATQAMARNLSPLPRHRAY